MNKQMSDWSKRSERELEEIEGDYEEVEDIHLPREISAPDQDHKEQDIWPPDGN